MKCVVLYGMVRIGCLVCILSIILYIVLYFVLYGILYCTYCIVLYVLDCSLRNVSCFKYRMSSILYCILSIVLHVLHVLYCMVLYGKVLYGTVLYGIVLYVLYCILCCMVRFGI